MNYFHFTAIFFIFSTFNTQKPSSMKHPKSPSTPINASQHRLPSLFPRSSFALPSPFLRSSHTQRVWLSMPTPCLHLAYTLPKVCEKLPIDDAGGKQKGVSGGEVALLEDALRQGYILLLKNHRPGLCRMIINQDLL